MQAGVSPHTRHCFEEVHPIALSQANQVVGVVILIGGLGLLCIATSTVIDGPPGSAAFIGACGLALLGAVGWADFQSHRLRSQDDPAK